MGDKEKCRVVRKLVLIKLISRLPHIKSSHIQINKVDNNICVYTEVIIVKIYN